MKLSLTRPWILLLLAAAWTGCDGGAGSGTPDLRPDCVAQPATCGCKADDDCGMTVTPRCDVSTGACVPCLTVADNCPALQRCVETNGSYACRADCRSDVDCPKSDGGAITNCCSHACVDEDTDPSNCSACGMACPDVAHGTPGCALGVCGIGACKPGYGDCDKKLDNGCEINTSTDGNNCGVCGKVCTTGANGTVACVAGVCTITCSPGYADCNKDPSDGCESQPASDAKNCGMCGMDCGTEPNANIVCSGGACAVGSCVMGFGDCNKKFSDGCEDDTLTDASNCNVCGNACMPARGVGACVAGRCGIASCNMGYTDCNGLAGDGCEIATGVDPNNCGACGHVCTGAHSAQNCANATCVITSCDMGWNDCDLDPSTGCEAHTADDVANCGMCKNVCAAPPNATPTCINSACGIGGCNPGFADCDMMPGDGCEADLSTPATCAQCNVKCPVPQNATAGCNMGVCGVGVCVMPFGDCNMNAADGCEKNLSTDVSNCGVCNNPCITPNAVPQCAGGMCLIMMCAQGFHDCDMKPGNGCESPTAADPANCGACGKVCPGAPNAMPLCTNSACGLACSGGFADCNKNLGDGCEINLKTDVANCNSCNHMCPAVANATAGCSSGVCGIASCNNLWGDCDNSSLDGCEKNLSNDVLNCGACNKSCVTANATPLCSIGQCSIGSCNAGFADCDGNWATGCEVPTTSDPMNCGGCHVVCPNGPNADATCVNSKCGLTCALGFGDCDHIANNGCEIDLRIDVNNCNACSTPCNPPNAAPVCANGVCGISACNNLFGDCDNNPADGCERSLASDVNNCGACGKGCVTPHAAAQCTNGVCGIAMCSPGFSDCNGSPADGCEVPTAADPMNCGGCKIVCPGAPNAVASCVNSKCGLSCAPNFADCDHVAGNGCEVDLRVDINNCNGCGSVCAPANSSPVCMGGVCSIGQCNNLFGDCNNNPADGCEKNFSTDPNNCGVCGNMCLTPNATPQCLNASCAVGACFPGFSDCNGLVADGCESPTGADVNNCGNCGNVCAGAANAVPSCVSSKCSLACSQGFADCNGNLNDGCESNTRTDLNNCGACGSLCAPANATPSCSNGVCSIQMCQGTFVDCNNNVADGCEKDLSSDVFNCGVCGAVCNTPNARAGCTNGKCNIAICKAGWTDCDGLVSTGCEAFTPADPNNCGVCGKVCPGNTPFCSKGVCSATQAVVGQFFVDDGPAAGTNPVTMSCLDSCANLFGGSANQYSCSTSNAMITHTAWMDGYNDQHCNANALAENYKKGVTYNCGVFQCSYSAYVKDHSPTCHVTDYCYR